MNRRRTTLAIVALIIVGVVVFVGRCDYRIRSFDTAHARISRDATEAAVVALMGSPEHVETRVSAAFWDEVTLGDDVARRVVKQYWYTVKGWYVPISWTVGFDADGRVISKHRLD